MLNTFKDHLWACILAGGGGTRLWPLSREKNPKQFIKLFGDRTLLQVTADRFSKFVPWEKIFIVTTSTIYWHTVKKELPKLPAENILIEPVKRNTAIAHGLAAAYIIKRDPNAVIVNEYADHVTSPLEKYTHTFLAAAQAAYETKSLVAIGLTPKYPHTGMGHIKIGKAVKKFNHRTAFKVLHYHEKPPLETAQKYTQSGNYLWNGGMYVWRADTILEALLKYEPKIGHALEKIQHSIGETTERSIINQAYKTAPSIAVDYAVSERAKNFLAIRADFLWIDVGDWNIVWELAKKDDEGNALISMDSKGKWIPIKTSNTLVKTDKLLICTVGVNNLVIIETDDAVLIANRENAQMVKELVNTIKEKKEEEYL